jgi:hypothetical protein
MSLASDILGFWSLVSRIDVDAAGHRHIDPALGPDPLGVLCFAPARFAAQFSKRDRSETVGTPSSPSVARANNSPAIDGYDAYFGSYTLDERGGLLTVTLDAALSPAGVGQSYTRRVRADLTSLVIQLETAAVDGTPITRTLTFDRAR